MSDNFIRHFVATCGTLVAIILYWIGYEAGMRGWWWTALTVVAVYIFLYKLIEA